MNIKAIVKYALVLISSLMMYRSVAHSEELPKDSFYQVAGQWKNQNGTPSSLKEYKGEAVIVTMTYTGCEFSCPTTIAKLEEIEKALKKKGVKNYQFVIASFDSEKDKPEALKAYMKKRKMDETNWTFLSAPSDQEVRKLAVLLDISYQKIDKGDFSHSNTITLLDPLGRVGTKLKGLASPHEELIEKALSYEKQN